MRFPEIKKEMFKDLEYYIEFYVTNETFDRDKKIENLMIMRSDPMFTGSRKALEDQILYLLDENPTAFRLSEEEKAQKVEEARMQQMQEIQAPQPMTA